MTRCLLTLVVVLLPALAPHGAAAQAGGAYQLRLGSIGAGGETFATGGAYRMAGTAAQYAAGPTSGGAYSIAGGLWVPEIVPNVGIEDDETPLPATFGVRLAGPNPFQGTTSLRFDLPEPRAVSIALYGVDGRLVRALVDAPFGAGRHAAYWDGRDGAGHDVAPGIYFARVVAGDTRTTLRLVRLH